MTIKQILGPCLGLFLLGTGAALAQRPVDVGGPPEIISHKMNPHPDAFAPTAGGTAALSPITNHGGPVMQGTINVYIIWYGNWNQANGSDTPAGQQLVRTFLGNIGNTSYFNINKTYTGVTGAVTLVKEISDSGSQGTRLSDAKVQSVVSSALSTGKLPYDYSGVYFVLTSSNVSESSGFCTRYCGWHTYATLAGTNIKYSFVGNANRCLNGCAAQTISPNGNAGVDGMISVIAHELEEAASDPQLNAWYDSSGAENADKCAWTFGSAQTVLPSGAYYNMTIGGLNFLVQRNLSAADNKCYVSTSGQQ
jgi:hypothetical protein